MSVALCPHCGGAIQNDGSLAGQTVECPYCKGTFAMPTVSTQGKVSGVGNASATITHGSASRQSSRRRKAKLKIPAWVWLVGGAGALFVLCCGGPLLLAPFITPTQTTQEQRSSESIGGPDAPEISESWKQAWASLPTKENGEPDLAAADYIDIQTAKRIDHEAGVVIEELWRERQERKIQEQRRADEAKNKRFTRRDYESLVGCDESFVEAVLGVKGKEASSAGEFKVMTYTDDHGAIISVSYRHRPFLGKDGEKQWYVEGKSQIGLE